MDTFYIVDAALSIPRKSSRGWQADTLRKPIIERNGHRVGVDSIPCGFHIAVSSIWMPVLRHSMIWHWSVKGQPTCDMYKPAVRMTGRYTY
jgi:hypothetical protein